jgi:hypothetical protein
MDDVYFRAWVANTCYAISGIWPLDWQGSQRKCALTTEEIRAAACQEVWERKFAHHFAELERLGELGTTNKPRIH